MDGDRSRGNKDRQSCGGRDRAARVRGKSEEQGKRDSRGLACGSQVGGRGQGGVQSHKLLLSGWPWRQLPHRSSCSEPPTPTPALEEQEGSTGVSGERAERGVMDKVREGKQPHDPDLQSFLALGLRFLKQ